jgi:SHS2 domain-containing protein
MYETFAHTADLGLRVRADSREALFQEAARGLFSMLVFNLGEVRPAVEIRIELAADEIEYQLFDWLSELLYRFDTEHLLLCQFDVQFTAGELTAVCRGETLDPQRHQMDHEVKAITYHGLQVESTEAGWLAEVIVDV